MYILPRSASFALSVFVGFDVVSGAIALDLKGPVLRGLASRPPYFHNGSAHSLGDAVDFYDKRFKIGFTSREKRDLIAFLNTL